MNRKMIFSVLGQIITIEAGLMLLPLITALCFSETRVALSFLATIVTAAVVGLALHYVFKPENKVMYAKEGFVIVALGWILMSAIGAVPFVLSGDIPSYVDAFFEIVSGFTTTGSTILPDVSVISHGTHMWRAFSHWIGGMGVLVFVMAIVPSISDRSIHIMRAEMPGPIVGKIVPRARQTARILYIIYFSITALEVVLLLLGGMNLFESLVHAFSTAGTGGFGIKPDSVGSYSPYIQWVIAIFMFMFGVNFNLYYIILLKKFKSAISSSELWAYIGIAFTAITLITINIAPTFEHFGDAIRASFFQVSSIVTTTGFSTVDFNLWPSFSKTILVMLMFIGGCAGSTAGGFKVARIVMIFKMIRQELRRMLHPRSVSTVTFEGKVLDRTVLSSLSSYLAIYVVLFFAILLVISLEPFDFETNFTAVAACFNNIGPGLSAVGPMSSFAGYSPFAKIILSFTMLFGRLEIYPLLFLFSPSTWTKK